MTPITAGHVTLKVNVRFWIVTSMILKTFLTTLCFPVTYVPQDWRDGNITPLHKKGPRKLCSNGNWSFRPITISAHDNIGP